MTAAATEMTFELLVAPERTNLLRFCTHLTGNAHAAEDLVQETLLTAWQKRETVTDPSGLSHWLKAIARNICRHWHRSRTRQGKHLLLSDLHDSQGADAEFDMVDEFDLDIELERAELITLLDRAMGLLPPETRGLLIQHYIEELPQAELAAQVGLSTGAVGVRLHRGKLALRQALTTNFRDDAVAFGLVTPTETKWAETRIWCFNCGQQRLLGHFDHAQNLLQLRCPGCCNTSDEDDVLTDSQLVELQGVKAFKPAFSRVLNSIHALYFAHKKAGFAPCYRCGAFVPIRSSIIAELPGFHDAYVWCEQCQEGTSADSWQTLALALPQVRQFWRDHPRMVKLPAQQVEIAGSPAVLTGFTSVTDRAKIEMAFSTNTFELIYIQ